MNRYWRRPRKSTWFAVTVFVVSFGFWLTQPQPDKPVRYPDDGWVFVTTTTEPPPVETVPADTTVPTDTTVPADTTVPTDTTLPPDTTVTGDTAAPTTSVAP